jgi:hypothetical protein
MTDKVAKCNKIDRITALCATIFFTSTFAQDTSQAFRNAASIAWETVFDNLTLWLSNRSDGFPKGESMNTRSLGVLCMVGSGLILLDAARMAALGYDSTADFSTLNLVAGSLWAVGGIAGLLGLIRLNVLGANPVVRALGFIPIIGFGLLIVANILQMAGVFNTENNTPAGIGWLVQMSGMVLVGILTIAVKAWDGWKRFVPLLAVVLAPLGFALGSLMGDLNLGVMPVYGVWVLLGYLVSTSDPAPARHTLATA